MTLQNQTLSAKEANPYTKALFGIARRAIAVKEGERPFDTDGFVGPQQPIAEAQPGKLGVCAL